AELGRRLGHGLARRRLRRVAALTKRTRLAGKRLLKRAARPRRRVLRAGVLAGMRGVAAAAPLIEARAGGIKRARAGGGARQGVRDWAERCPQRRNVGWRRLGDR